MPSDLAFQHDDGGRSTSGFTGDAPGDCVPRAFAILLGRPYREVYDELAERCAAAGKPRSARNGVPTKVMRRYAADNGLVWVPTMTIGSGTTVHLRRDELPVFPVIARVSKHVTTVIDGVIRDTYDPSRDGTRAVYGYFARTIDIPAQ